MRVRPAFVVSLVLVALAAVLVPSLEFRPAYGIPTFPLTVSVNGTPAAVRTLDFPSGTSVSAGVLTVSGTDASKLPLAGGALTGAVTDTFAVAAAYTPGFTASTSTAATNNNQKWSPSIEQCGNGWSSGAGGSSQTLCWGIALTPVQAATATQYMSLYYTTAGSSTRTEFGQLTPMAGNGLKLSSNGNNLTLSGNTQTLILQDGGTFGITIGGETIVSGNIRSNTVGGNYNGTVANPWLTTSAYYAHTTVGTPVSSGTTITPTSGFFHVTGTAAVATINVPFTGFTGCIQIVPDGIFTTTTGGNISLASVAVVNRILIECYDGTKWNPSY